MQVQASMSRCCLIRSRAGASVPLLTGGSRPQVTRTGNCSSCFSGSSCKTQLAPASRSRASVVANAALSVESIVDPFLWANSAVTYAWLLLIIAPRWEVTKKVFKSELAVVIPALAFLYFFIAATQIDSSTPEELNQKSIFLFTEAITDPRLMVQLVTPAYIAQDWVHLLAWDFIFGRYIWLEALEKNLPMRHSLFVTFAAGPIGLLVHVVTKAVVEVWRKQQPQAVGEGEAQKAD